MLIYKLQCNPAERRGSAHTMVVAQRRFAFLFAAAASAVEQPLLLCSPGGRDGFGSQYFHHMAVFGACAAHGDCCYVHSSFQTLAHGADPRRAEAFTGLRSGDACRHLLSSPRRDETLPPDPEGASIGCSNGRLRREGATAGWQLSTIEWPRPAPKYSLWTFLHNATTRGALRRLYDAAPKVGFPAPPDCAVRIHARRGDHVVAGGAAGHKETNATLLCVVDAALRRAPGATVCVYSEGRPEGRQDRQARLDGALRQRQAHGVEGHLDVDGERARARPRRRRDRGGLVGRRERVLDARAGDGGEEDDVPLEGRVGRRAGGDVGRGAAGLEAVPGGLGPAGPRRRPSSRRGCPSLN